MDTDKDEHLSIRLASRRSVGQESRLTLGSPRRWICRLSCGLLFSTHPARARGGAPEGGRAPRDLGLRSAIET
jgi:hypothetical protein